MDKRLIPILFLNFVNVLGFSVLIPVLPFIVERFGGGEITYGALLATYPAFQFLAAPVLGTLSDRHGRRRLLLISQAGTLASWGVFGAAYFAPEIPVFGVALPLAVIAFSRIVDGITGGNFSVANAYVADITPREKKTQVYGLLGAVVGIGIIIGPVIGGYVFATPLGYLGIALVSAIISAITLALMYAFLPETLPEEKRDRLLSFHILQEINLFHKFASISAMKLRRLFLMRAFFALAFASYTSTIVLLLKQSLFLSPERIGTVFLIIGSFFIVNQTVITKRLSDRYGALKTFYLGQLLFGIGLVLLVFVRELWQLYPVIYITNLGFSSSFPTFRTVITNIAPENRQGFITGLDESVLAGASAVAPLAASIIYSLLGQYSYGLFAMILLMPHFVIRAHIAFLRPRTAIA